MKTELLRKAKLLQFNGSCAEYEELRRADLRHDTRTSWKRADRDRALTVEAYQLQSDCAGLTYIRQHCLRLHLIAARYAPVCV